MEKIKEIGVETVLGQRAVSIEKVPKDSLDGLLESEADGNPRQEFIVHLSGGEQLKADLVVSFPFYPLSMCSIFHDSLMYRSLALEEPRFLNPSALSRLLLSILKQVISEFCLLFKSILPMKRQRIRITQMYLHWET